MTNSAETALAYLKQTLLLLDLESKEYMTHSNDEPSTNEDVNQDDKKISPAPKSKAPVIIINDVTKRGTGLRIVGSYLFDGDEKDRN